MTFNWTKVELKLSYNDANASEKSAFNWTKVELKLGEKPIDEQHLMLLIELR